MVRPIVGVVGALAACMAAVGGCAPTRTFETPTGPHFSVLTYNVNFGGPGVDATIDAIKAAEADIVCLQETTPDWEGLLRQRVVGRYPHMLFLYWGGAGGMAVLSRDAMVEVHRVLPTAGWFPAWVLRVQTPAGPVQVANVHLRPALGEKGRISIGALFETKEIRRKEAEALWARMDPQAATIILGDFNEGDGGQAIAYLTARGLVNALPEFDRHSHTWRWPTPVGELKARFDHVLYSPGLHCLRAEVFDRGASDHLPVMAVFQNAKPKQARLPERARRDQGRNQIREGQTTNVTNVSECHE